jgi:hypothetical protein
MSEARDAGSDSPMTRVFRQLADAADAPDGRVRIIELARQFDAALGPADQSDASPDPSEDSEAPEH